MLISKYLSIGACAILFQGCSFNSFMFEANENKPIVIIEHPPNRVAYGGNLNDADMKQLKEVLVAMQKMPYKDYHYDSPLGVTVQADIVRKDESSFTGSTTLKKQEVKDVQEHTSDIDIKHDSGM